MKLSALATLVLCVSCAAKKPAAPVAPQPPPSPSPAGTATYSFVFDPANPALGLAEDVKFNRPLPRETLKLPDYPGDALAAGDGPHRELVRIIIDRQGHVTEVGDSPLGTSDGGLHAASFRAAVDSAVRTWSFAPGALLHVEPGNDLDGDGKPDYTVAKSIDIVPVYYDVRFTFQIVDGKGVVTKE